MKIIYIFGKSGTGKDTIKSILLKRSDIDIVPLPEYTTRPMRAGETNGTEHIFISPEEFDSMVENGEFLEHRSYPTREEHPRNYGTAIPSYESPELIYVGTGTLVSYMNIKEKYPDDVLPIYLEVPDYLRLARAINREMGAETEVYAEICRRFLTDIEDYAPEKLQSAGIDRHNTIKNIDSLSGTISKIMAYIIKNTKKERELQKAKKENRG